MSESTEDGDEFRREEPVNEMRVRLYEQLHEGAGAHRPGALCPRGR